MTCPHFEIRICTRRKNENTVAKAAYQSGEKLFDERSNRTKYYRKEHEVVYKEILLPPHAPPEYLDRNTLWNAVERAEPNWNSQLARRFNIALPRELSMDDRISLIRKYAEEQFVKKGMIADIAIHDPDPPEHNPHAHILLTMRPMAENGCWMPKSKKEYELDEAGNRIRDSNGRWKTYKVFTTDWDDRGNAERWRHAWEVIQNEYLERAGSPERIDMRSFKRQGIDRIPTVHMGPAVAALEKRGIQTDIGDLNREIKNTNRLLRNLKEKLNRLLDWIKDVREALREIDMEPKEIPLYDLIRLKFDERSAERTHWDNRYGKQKAAIRDLKRYAGITDYMIGHDILTVSDLTARTDAVMEEHDAIRQKIKGTRKRMDRIDKIREKHDRMKELTPIHDAYVKINWKKKKESFYTEHRDELEEWKKCSRYLHKNLPDGKYDPKALSAEYRDLKKDLENATADLTPVAEEAELLKDIRYLIKEYLPELTPEREALTPERKNEKRASIKETLAWAKKEADAYNAARKNTLPAHPEAHDIER